MRRPDTSIAVLQLGLMTDFFNALRWTVEVGSRWAIVTTPGGRFGLELDPAPPKLELALGLPDPLQVDELVEVVEPAGGIVMEPPQETTWGGWGFSFNDPEGNTWEIGSPFTVTAIDYYLTTQVRPVTGPIVSLAVPRKTAT